MTTVYVRDGSGNVMSIYEKISGQTLKQTEVYIYGSSRLGMATEKSLASHIVIPLDGDFGNARSEVFTRGEKFFELSNHLGNVLVTVSDKKLQYSINGTTVDYYEADITSANDYYPFGSLMPGRKWNGGKYRYGFNGQENSTEIEFYGNSYTAEFWQYDSRLGRRWNLDPKPTIGISLYVTLSNNPLYYSDPLGDTTAPLGDWYRKQEGKNVTYKYAMGKEKEQMDADRKTWWPIPESSRKRIVTFGNSFEPQEVQSSIDLHPDGTFTVLKSDIREPAVDGHIRWHIQLSSGGHLNVQARDYMQSKAVGDGAFWGAAGALAGDRAIKVGGLLINRLAAKGGGQSLGAGRTAVKQWLQGAGNLERGTLIQNIESAGFKRISPPTSPIDVFKRGGMRIRLDPPQSGTPFNHMHLEYGGNSYNIFLNPVNFRSPAAHIPIR